VYIAGPLFTPYERGLNARIAEILEGNFDTFLPQRDGVLIPGRDVSRQEFIALSKEVFAADTRAIQESDLLLAVLDGRAVDEGVAFELGCAHALGKECIGFRSDARVLLPGGHNPMIEGALSNQLSSEDELAIWVRSRASSGKPV
jgi:nucleoside 2-deoxyribosyltransferase